MYPSNNTEPALADAPSSPTAAIDALLLVFRLQGHLAAMVAQECRDDDLGAAEAIALIALTRSPEPISGVAKAAGIRPNGASVLVERLRTRGLVTRERSKRDSRIVTVELTDEGRAVAGKLIERVGDQMRFALSPLPAAEREGLVLLLGRIAGP